MKATLTYKGVSQIVDIPTRWLELKFRHFVELHRAGVFKPNAEIDWLKVFSIFTGLTEHELEAATWVDLDDLLVALTFLITDIPTGLPKTVLGYTIPQDIGFETVGQYKYLKEDVKASGELSDSDQIARYALYLATYACSQKHGEFSWVKCEEMAEEFLDAPAPEVLAVAHFTLLKLIGLTQHIEIDYLKRHTRKMRWRQAFRSLWRSLASMERLWSWKRKPASQPTS